MKVDLVVPNSLADITLGQYQKFVKISESNTDEKFISIKMLEIFCKLKLETIMTMKATSIKTVTATLTEMFNAKQDLKHIFRMDGIQYGFIPNLEDMTFGEYVDLDSNISDFQEIHKAMAVLYRPIEKKFKGQYTIKPYEAKEADFMRDMPMDVVFGSMIFFYHLGSDLSKVMMDYLQQEESRELHTQLLELSAKNGVGINQFLNSLKEMLHSSKISLN
tara:strand:+ start:383 stop:1039 length:657 start_codon:yes stop_codon:yes gene_type:complete